MSEWNYKVMGFDSPEEMKASIERAKKAKNEPLNDLQQRAINLEKTKTQLGEHGGIDFKSLEEGARLAQLDNEVLRRMYHEEEQAKKAKETAELNSLLRKAGESTIADSKAAADARIKEQTDKAFLAAEKQIKKELGLKSEEEIKKEESYKGLLKGLRGE